MRVSVGAFLLSTAALKAHGHFADPLKTELLGIPSGVQILAIQVELLLGLWLMSGLHVRRAVQCAIVFFALVSCIASQQVYDKQTTCGCFGAFDVSPTNTLLVDLGAFLLLAVVLYLAPRDAHDPGNYGASKWYILGYLIFLSVLLTLPGLTGFVSYQNFLRSLRGEFLETSPRVVDLGETILGERKTTHLQVTNHSETTVRVVGGSASCGCMVYEDLPLEVPPRSTRSIRVSVLKNGGQGLYRDRLVLYTNHPAQPAFQAGVTGWLSAKPKDALSRQGR